MRCWRIHGSRLWKPRLKFFVLGLGFVRKVGAMVSCSGSRETVNVNVSRVKLLDKIGDKDRGANIVHFTSRP